LATYERRVSRGDDAEQVVAMNGEDRTTDDT